MKATICTLFEKNYHYGVGVLINSLSHNGFEGDVYAGYKGALPDWSTKAVDNDNLGGLKAKSLKVSESITLHFISLNTHYHLTNYKPDFMLDILNGPAIDVDYIFYYDPDIIQKASWYFMEQWVNAGVAVAEDFNSPISEFHPRRAYWRSYFSDYNFQLKFKNSIYVNGGFLGLKKNNFDFLTTWRTVQLCMEKEIGSLSNSIFENKEKLFANSKGDFYAFGTSDQDALNVAIEIYNLPISFLGKEAMCFELGFSVIPHAIGKPKPWESTLIRNWLFNGQKPSYVELLFWSHSTYPLKIYSKRYQRFKLLLIKIIRFGSRIYRN